MHNSSTNTRTALPATRLFIQNVGKHKFNIDLALLNMVTMLTRTVKKSKRHHKIEAWGNGTSTSFIISERLKNEKEDAVHKKQAKK